MNHKAAKGQATRRHIVSIATKLFAKSGYEATSIEVVLAKSAVSRGALYHHFDSKEALFAAVLEAIEAEIAEDLAAASRGIADPVDAMRAGCAAWLKLSRSPAIRQIVLIDAPAVVGWEKWREIDARFGFGLLKAWLKSAAEAGRVDADKVEVLAHVLLAALMELALVIARAADPVREARRGKAVVDELIDKLLGPPRRRR